jgi:hypothetical protein
MFWGGMIGGSGYFYSYDYDGSDNYELYGEGGFNAGLLWGYDFGLLALQGELLLTGESAKSYFYYSYPYSSYTQTEYSAMGLRIPLMVKLDLHWWRLMFQPQAGLYLNFGLGDMDYETYDGGSVVASGSVGYDSPLFGVMFGGALGVRIGRGYLFLDLRYARDLGETGVEGFKFTRSAVMGNFGYQYYFKSKQ